MFDTQKVLQLFNDAQNFKAKGELEKSANLYEEILKITNKLPEVYFNLAFVYMDLDRLDDGIFCLKEYLKAEPEDAEAKYFLAVANFKNFDYEAGFSNFEYRISKEHAIGTQIHLYQEKFLNIPFWQGEDLTDKTIYVYYEAGLGDTIMYFRYLDLLAKRCKKVYFKPQVHLLSLFAENKNSVQIIMRLTDEIAKKCDFQCPIMSLPYFLGLNNKTIFLDGKPFLHAPKRKANLYKEKYFDNDKLKIGIKWQGNTLIGAERAINASSYLKLFDINNAKIYSLQVMDGYEQINDLLELGIEDLGSTFKDFADTISAMENLDIVICNDTSVAHLAGAMGKKCYIILPNNYDWRWHKDISKCNWYNSVKLFRKNSTWNEVVERIYLDLTHSF
ncbi:hypothetical protein IJG72_05700 [bacterium]|nr:hypothetical protein [bacterium]